VINYAFHRGQYDPQWTQPEYQPGGDCDALRLETLSESILANLLPGINNQTRHARYYSFWAWVLRDFILDADTTHTQESLYEWLRRHDEVLILVYLIHGASSPRTWMMNQYRCYWSEFERREQTNCSKGESSAQRHYSE
jgi:hypothetical protein